MWHLWLFQHWRKLDIIDLPLAKSISLSLDRYLSSENLGGVNKWFYPACNGFMDSTRETRITDSESILVVHVVLYNNFRGAVIKNNKSINCCSETLRLPISADEQVCLYKEFTLNAIINLSRTLQAGHYWAHIKNEDNRLYILSLGLTSLHITPVQPKNQLSPLSFYLPTAG